MKLLIAAAGFAALSIGSAAAAPNGCDADLIGGKITAGRIISFKTTNITSAKDKSGAPIAPLPAVAPIKEGTLSAATLSAGRASGGKLAGKQCRGVTLKDATLSGAIITDANLTSAPAVKYDLTADGTEVTLEDVTIDNPVGALQAPADPTITTEAKDIPLAGDWFKFKTDVVEAHVGEHADKDTSGQSKLRIPKDACFRVATEVEETTGTEKRNFARGSFYSGSGIDSLFPPYGCNTRIGNARTEPKSVEDAENDAKTFVERCKDATSAECKAAREKLQPLDLNRIYDIPSELLVSHSDRYRYGWTWGVMVAPFKYYRSTRTFDAGAQVGPYIGYRIWDRPGASTILAASVGATSKKVRTTDAGGNPTEDTKNGFSWAFGIITEFKNSFNVGFLWGMDMFSAADNVQKGGNHWISISIGLKLNN